MRAQDTMQPIKPKTVTYGEMGAKNWFWMSMSQLPMTHRVLPSSSFMAAQGVLVTALKWPNTPSLLPLLVM